MTNILQHHGATEIAAYIDGKLSPGASEALEAHLASCRECRRELREVDQIVRRAPSRSRRLLYPIGVAAAAAVLLFVVSPAKEAFLGADSHRDPAVTATVPPRAIGPLGNVHVLDTIEWSGVPGADRYSVTVFDENGAVLWETEVTDTVTAFPPALHLFPGQKYFWSVRAKIGWDRWVDSPVTEFGLPAEAAGQ